MVRLTPAPGAALLSALSARGVAVALGHDRPGRANTADGHLRPDRPEVEDGRLPTLMGVRLAQDPAAAILSLRLLGPETSQQLPGWA
jgi:hypothetical protein